MTGNAAYKQYRENTAYTATPEELTLMLYNGLVKFIMQGMAAIDQKDYERAHEAILKSQNIVIEFQSTLDKRYEIAKQLELIYDYLYRRLIDANIDKDAGILEEVLDFARDLRDTWTEAMKIAKKQVREMEKVAGAR